MPSINLEAEQALLGCIIHEGELIKEISLQPEHFFDSKHKIIFEIMRELEKKDEPINIVTMYMSVTDKVENSYITDISNSIPSVEGYRRYEKYVLDAWKLRKAELAATKLKQEATYARDSTIISDTIQELTRLEEVGFDQDFSLKNKLMEVHEELENQEEGLTGVDTGYTDLNMMTNGLQNQDLIILAARPSVGKTAFALNVGINACEKSNACVTIFSLEMPDKSLLKRMICAAGNIDANMMKNPKRFFKDSANYNRYQSAVGYLSRCNLNIYDEGKQTVQQMRARLRRLKRKYPDVPHLAIIDYLQLIQGSGNNNRVQEVSEISRSIKIMARDFDMPIICLSQLSRSVEQRQDKRPMLSDLRESGGIEQDADLIMFLYRDDYYDKESQDKNTVEVILGKQRNGPTGMIKLGFHKEYNRFVNLAWYEVEK